MKILFVSRTPYSGGHIRMADALAAAGHETRALSPCTWWPEIQKLDHKRKRDGRVWWIENRLLVDKCLEWTEAIHFTYSSSLHDLGRPDLLGKKPCVWHLATMWKDRWYRFFPDGAHKHYRFVVSAEGWDRYPLPPWDWKVVPVLFPIDEPAWRPIPFAERERRVTMTPRLTTDTWDQRKIPAPRGVPEIQRALSGLPFDAISGVGHEQAMREKASSWLGIDDVVNPMLHLSGFEYLSLGVPCLNQSDEHMRRQLGEITGGPWPFIDAEIENGSVTAAAKWALGGFEGWTGVEPREWMEGHYSAALMAPRYVELYQ